MRVLIDGAAHAALTPAEEQDVRQFRAEESVVGSVLSAEEASKARLSQTRLVFVILWLVATVVAVVIASLAEPADRTATVAMAAVTMSALGAFFAFQLWRRTRIWQRDLPRRLAGMAPAGSAIGVDAAGVAVAGQIFPWSALAIEQVELARYGARYRTMFTLERLALVGPGGVVVLDPAMMQNGHLIVGNVWRRMRLAGRGATV